ncbi:pyruvate formate lyase family protein, partial [Pseudomonas aeruginosa]|nr:pyruvate formate lyase family protein [Pseudomonas aeruginosa]
IPRAADVDPVFHCGWLSEELDTIATRKQDPYFISEEDKKELRETIFPYWKGKIVSELWLRQIPPYVREMAVKTGIIDVEIKTQSAAGETAPYWEKAMNTGLGQMEKELADAIDALDPIDPESYEKITFYKA